MNEEPAPSASDRAILVDDTRFGDHIPPGDHPERPERLAAVRAAVARSSARFDSVLAREATDDQLARVHSPRFVERLSRLRGRHGYLDPDTYVSPHSVEVARLAAGSVVAMVEGLIDGPVARGVALLRPPGHHAGPSHAMGFCLLNNVAIAAAHARACGLRRIAIVDWDVHHGNGTQEMFWSDPSVLYISTHQFPFYPGTGDVGEIGDADGAGFTVNIPLAAGSGDAVYAAAFERVVLPVIESYAPELILVSAGFDASAEDPLAQMLLSPAAFGWMAHQLRRCADASARGRMALVLEGGYDLSALEAGMKSAIDGMIQCRAPNPGRTADEGVDRAATVAKKTWAAVG
jgi:acetoin utilization deacetylase AcuC-like enzyme